MALFPTRTTVRGLADFQRDFGRLSKTLQRRLQAELRKIGEPAADLIRREARGHRFSEGSVAGIRSGTRRGGVVIRQSRGKVTGKRADFGSTQYRQAFVPGADMAQPIVAERVEDWLDKVTDEAEGGAL